jgi:hypothetical protein
MKPQRLAAALRSELPMCPLKGKSHLCDARLHEDQNSKLIHPNYSTCPFFFPLNRSPTDVGSTPALNEKRCIAPNVPTTSEFIDLDFNIVVKSDHHQRDVTRSNYLPGQIRAQLPRPPAASSVINRLRLWSASRSMKKISSAPSGSESDSVVARTRCCSHSTILYNTGSGKC